MQQLNALNLTLLGGLGAVAKEGAVVVAHIARTGRGPWRPSRGRRPPGTDETTPRAGFYALALVLKVFLALCVVGVLSIIEAASPIAAFLIGANAGHWLQLATAQIALPNGQLVPQIMLPSSSDLADDGQSRAVPPATAVLPSDPREATP